MFALLLENSKLEKETLVNEESFISSGAHGETNKTIKRRQTGSKVLINVGNLRMSAYPLLEDHPKYEEGMPIYEVLGYWAARPQDGLGNENTLEGRREARVLNRIAEADDGIIELELDTFTIQPIGWKRRS